MIYYGCPKCEAPMASPDSLAGRTDTCPSCGNVAPVPRPAAVPVAQPRQVVRAPRAEILEPDRLDMLEAAAAAPRRIVRQAVDVRHGGTVHHAATVTIKQKHVSGLGVAALVLGIIACLTAWIPVIGIVAIPIAALGLLFAVIGGLVAIVGRETSPAMPFAGMIVCGVAIALQVFWIGALSAVGEAHDRAQGGGPYDRIQRQTEAIQRELDGGAGSEVASPPVTAQPATKNFTIDKVDAKVTEANSVWAKFAWQVTLTSQVDKPLLLNATIEFLDKDGFIIDTDLEGQLLLPPRETKTFRGYALVNASVARNIDSFNAKVEPWP